MAAMEPFKREPKSNPESNNKRVAQSQAEQKPLSVIETLASGFEAVLQQPWLVLIPLALDLFLWLAPQISVKPIFEQTLPTMLQALPPDAAPDTRASLEMLKQLWQVAGDTLNLWGILATGIPSIVGMQSLAKDDARTIALLVDNRATLLLVLGGLGGAALAITTIYLEAVAWAVRRDTQPPAFMPRLVRAGADLAVLVVLVLIGMFLLILPLTLGATLVSLVSQGLGSFIIFGTMLLLMWVGLYLTFTSPAIFAGRLNAPQAILTSVSVFRFDFWSAMALIFLMYIIRAGFTFVWQFLASNPWGIVFDVIANAFIGSGLMAAAMVFYQDRVNWMAIVRERLRQQQTRGKS